MGDNTERMLGQLDGKLDSLITLVRDHVEKDDERFAHVFNKIEEHAADINKAKGAKAAVYTVAAVVSGFVGAAITAADKLLK